MMSLGKAKFILRVATAPLCPPMYPHLCEVEANSPPEEVMDCFAANGSPNEIFAGGLKWMWSLFCEHWYPGAMRHHHDLQHGPSSLLRKD
ncbi:hypothetical protein KOW79_019632 [Hemibagrus wyckioides]|uniref:Uncharacterized protein n=1 Tax=Hemibagrus wyckioides TaxID=337641 RepID=A0A9D3N7H0_9TELE|nr:hypothetical protein KOW79_019632 [Hemibagrus wyckioides]